MQIDPLWIQVLTTAIIGIATIYYARKVNQQVNQDKRRLESIIQNDIINRILVTWINQLNINKDILEKFTLDLSIINGQIQMNTDLLYYLENIDILLLKKFKEEFTNEENQIQEYKIKILKLQNNIISFARNLITDDIFEIINRISRVDRGRQWEKNEIIILLIRYITIQPIHYQRFSQLRIFHRDLWQQFEQRIENLENIKEEGGQLFRMSKELANESSELINMLKDIISELCDKYYLSRPYYQNTT